MSQFLSYGFSWLEKNPADFGSAQLFEGFFARTEMLTLAGVDPLPFAYLDE